MSVYMTIPEITDYEPLESVQHVATNRFQITMQVGEVFVRLQQAASWGTVIPLVALAGVWGVFALDDVVVSSVSLSSGDNQLAAVELDAQATRVI